MTSLLPSCSLFFFHDPPTTEIYTLSLHDALPIFEFIVRLNALLGAFAISAKHTPKGQTIAAHPLDRKSTRLNSSHTVKSYAVFCLKKKINSIKSSHRLFICK